MKTILIASDFSLAANNAAQYGMAFKTPVTMLVLPKRKPGCGSGDKQEAE